MNKSKIWLSSPHMGGNEQRFVNEAFASNWVAPLGPNVTGFEEDLENYLGGQRHVAALSSGTAALHLALIMLGVSAGDEVICQSFTFSASANPIVYQGALPVFIDSEPDSWNMCPDALESAIKDRIAKGRTPKAIVAVHLYGMPYKSDEIMEVASRYGIPVVEDSAEALGSTYRGLKCGTLGDISILSFNGNKIITTSGGGALVTRKKIEKDMAVFLSTQARDNAPHYQHSHIGYNYRLSNICAGIGRGQMQVLDKHMGLRRGMNAFYRNYFENIPAVKMQSEYEPFCYSNFWLTSVLVNPESGKNREGLRLAMEAENIECRPLWKPMHMQPIFAASPYYGSQVSEKLFADGLCLPSGSNLTDSDRCRIAAVFDAYFER